MQNIDCSPRPGTAWGGAMMVLRMLLDATPPQGAPYYFISCCRGIRVSFIDQSKGAMDTTLQDVLAHNLFIGQTPSTAI